MPKCLQASVATSWFSISDGIIYFLITFHTLFFLACMLPLFLFSQHYATILVKLIFLIYAIWTVLLLCLVESYNIALFLFLLYKFSLFEWIIISFSFCLLSFLSFIHSKILPQKLKFPFNTSNAFVCFIGFTQCIVIIIVIIAIMVVFLLEPSLYCSKAARLFLRLHFRLPSSTILCTPFIFLLSWSCALQPYVFSLLAHDCIGPRKRSRAILFDSTMHKSNTVQIT